jgi:hypothetical protein
MANIVQNDKDTHLSEEQSNVFCALVAEGYQPIPQGYQPRVRPGAPEPDLSNPPSGGMHIHYPKATQRPAEAARNNE